jgi:hypothetical protein
MIQDGAKRALRKQVHKNFIDPKNEPESLRKKHR